MMPPAIRRVPPQTKSDVGDWATPDEGRFIATFLIDQGRSGVVEYKVTLPWRDGDPTLAELEAEAREALRNRLTEIIAEI